MYFIICEYIIKGAWQNLVANLIWYTEDNIDTYSYTMAYRLKYVIFQIFEDELW